MLNMNRGCLPMTVLRLYLLPFMIALSQSFSLDESGNETETVRGCKNDCHMTSEDGLTCWDKSLAYHERILLTHLRNYAAVQANIDEWRKLHQSPTNFTATEEASINVMLEEKRRLIGESSRMIGQLNDLLVDEDSIRTVVHELISTVANGSDNQTEDNKTPHSQKPSCPIPCEHHYALYIYLFIASLILNIALAVIVVPFIMRTVRRDEEISQHTSPLVKK